MKNFSSTAFISLVLTLILFQSSLAISADDIIAVVNDKEITSHDLETYINMRIGPEKKANHLNAEQVRQILNEMINRELLFQDAIKKELDKNAEILRQINYQRQNLLANANIDEVLSIQPDLKEMQNLYRKNYSQGLREFHIRHIVLETKENSKMVLKKLADGENFSDLAKTFSIDASASNGGDLDWITASQLPPPMAKTLLSLKNKSYGKEAIKSDHGWHLIFLEDSRTVAPPKFESVKKNIAAIIQNKKAKEFIFKLREKAKLEIKE